MIAELLKEQPRLLGMEVPEGESEQERLLRSLFNIRPPMPVSDTFLEVQDAYLSEVRKRRGVTRWQDLPQTGGQMILWQGDITTLCADAIVNAANSALLGCFHPCHGCIDNAIHTYAGVQLRLACAAVMERQGHEEPVGNAKLTPAFNLPAAYVLHTVGPCIYGTPTGGDAENLAACYRSCLSLADARGLQSVAFCCISTGEFHFPNQDAARIAVRTVREYLTETQSRIKVIFNVYKEVDYEIYQALLGRD